MYHYIYKTTNLINGCYYIGCHSTKSLNNDYLGSGIYLNNSIKKYGKSNFKKEIWFLCKDRETKFYLESVIVNKELLKDQLCMNLRIGGIGGFGISYKSASSAGRNGGIATSKRFKEDWEFRNNTIERASKFNLERVKNGTHHWLNHKNEHWLGRKHKQETIEKMKKTHKKNRHQVGMKNSQFGTIWIMNGIESKKIKKDEIIPEKWEKGRIKRITYAY